MNDVKRTERGWAGHFCAASFCNFRRNTLLECGKTKIVVSTVGAFTPEKDKPFQEIGVSRYYETMAFHASKEGRYWDADVGRQIEFDSAWALSQNDCNADQEANDMHEGVVAELTGKMEKGEL